MKKVAPETGLRLELDGQSLKIEDVVACARRSEPVECVLSAESVEKIEASRRLKQDLIWREAPIYGVTTGFGERPPADIS